MELLCAEELLVVVFDSLLSETEDLGEFAEEELEIFVSPVLLVLGLVDESSPQAERMHAASKLQIKCFVFMLVPLWITTNIIKCKKGKCKIDLIVRIMS